MSLFEMPLDFTTLITVIWTIFPERCRLALRCAKVNLSHDLNHAVKNVLMDDESPSDALKFRLFGSVCNDLEH